jgi:hypothetical protein
MKKILFIAILACNSIASFAQLKSSEFFHEMDAAAKLTVPTEKEKTESAYYVVNEVLYEYAYTAKQDNLDVFYSHHVRIHLVDDKGVESFNTIDVPFDEKYYSIKARTILSDGTVKNLDNSNIKEKVDEETGRKRRIFALEGLSPGAEIEYVLVMQIGSSLQQRDFFQYAIPCRKAKFELITPENLVFETKAYGGFKNIIVDTTQKNVRHITAVQENLIAVPDERYSNPSDYMVRMDCQFVRNTSNKNFQMQTWEDFGRKINANYTATAEDRKRILAYLQDQKEYKQLKSQVDKIKWIENHTKTRFTLSEDVTSEDAYDIKYVLKNKVTTENGICNLLTAMYQAAGIKHDVVLTTDRNKCSFDKSFISSLNLKEMLLYFAEEDAYVKPDWMFYRYPLLPIGVQGNDALRCAKMEVGGVELAVGEVMTLPVQNPDKNNHDIHADIVLDLDESVAKVKMRHDLYGVMAAGYRPVFLLADKDRQQEVMKDLLNCGSQADKISAGLAVNTSFADASSELPLTLTADVESAELIEKAGPDYIVHVGKVIGKQVEMYQDKERVMDISIDFLHHLHRYITITIPKGYKAANLDKLVIDIKQGPPGKRYGFLSSYKIEGDKILIDADEWYCEQFTPKSEFERFKSVINAAADFEKATILFEKL